LLKKKNMVVTITINNVGTQVGTIFNIYSDIDNFVSPIAVSIPRSILTSGTYKLEVDDQTTEIKIVSIDGCGAYCMNTVQNIPSPSSSPTPTPTVTPTNDIIFVSPSPTPTLTPTPTSSGAVIFYRVYWNGSIGMVGLTPACAITDGLTSLFTTASSGYDNIPLYNSESLSDPFNGYGGYTKIKRAGTLDPYTLVKINTYGITNSDVMCPTPTPTPTVTPTVTPSAPAVEELPLILKYSVNAGDIIEIPLGPNPTVGNIPMYINWDDGSPIEVFIQSSGGPNPSHEYSMKYFPEIKLTGDCRSIYCNSNKLIEIVQWGNIKANSLCFMDCINLTTIPTGPITCMSISNTGVYKLFDGCIKLTAIPYNLFYNLPNIIHVIDAFKNCSSLESIPNELFSTNTNLYGFQSTFEGCSNITTIPSGLFANNVNATRFNQTFKNCSSLESIRSGLFANNINTTTFMEAFEYCSSLETIPTGLFTYNINVSDHGFSSTFAHCILLRTIPPGLFENLSLVSNEGFRQTFYNCSSLESIPNGLFKNCSSVSERGFDSTFAYCNSISGTIPYDIFQGCTSVSAYGFKSTFMGCENIETISQYMFNDCVNVSDHGFEWTFADCFSLMDIPSLLFRNNTLVGAFGFYHTFDGCKSIETINGRLFSTNLNVSESGFDGTFNSCSNLKKILSNPSDGSGLFSKSINKCDSFQDTFNSCTSLEAIPINLFGEIDSPRNIIFDSCFSRCTNALGEFPLLWNMFPNATGKLCFYAADKLDSYILIPNCWRIGTEC